MSTQVLIFDLGGTSLAADRVFIPMADPTGLNADMTSRNLLGGSQHKLKLLAYMVQSSNLSNLSRQMANGDEILFEVHRVGQDFLATVTATQDFRIQSIRIPNGSAVVLPVTFGDRQCALVAFTAVTEAGDAKSAFGEAINRYHHPFTDAAERYDALALGGITIDRPWLKPPGVHSEAVYLLTSNLLDVARHEAYR